MSGQYSLWDFRAQVFSELGGGLDVFPKLRKPEFIICDDSLFYSYFFSFLDI